MEGLNLHPKETIMANHIKLLTALAGLALLTACAGGVTNNIGEININNGETCDTNPYGADCGVEFETSRQTIASDCRTDDSGEFCTDAIKFVCDKNVDDRLCDNTPEYVRQRVTVMEQCTDTKTQTECDEEDRITACDANEFAANCPEQKYVDERKTACASDKTATRCEPTVALICGTEGDIFDDFCTGLPTTGAMRTAACQTHGTGAMGDSTCDTVIRTDCVANPFMHLGCATLDDTIRDNFCAKEANIFAHEDCGKLGNIGDLRMTYCTTTDIFHANCLDGTNGGDTERASACQTHGINESAGGDSTCDGGRSDIRVDCVADPFDYTGCDTLGDLKTPFCTTTKIFDDNCLDGMNGGDSARALACQTHGINAGAGGHSSCDNGRNGIRGACESDPFDHAGCTTLTGDLRMTFCTTTKIFDDNCLDGTNGGDTERESACQMYGITESAGGHSSCDNGRNGIRGACTDPFDYDGCDTLTGDLRMTFCTTTKIFDANCLDGTNGGDSERALACQEHGITSPMGDASCDNGRNGIRVACVANPFMYNGCTTLSGDLRTTLCTTTDIFNTSCLNDANGGKTERDNACLMHGINAGAGGHASCSGRDGVITACKLNPFAHNGCGDISTIDNIRIIYCRGTEVNEIADGSAADECSVNYADWQGGFTDTLTTTTEAGINKFLPNIDPTGRRSLNLNTATFDSNKLGGDAADGVVFYRTGTAENTSHFAGILAGTDLGKRIETTFGIAQWNGSFWATNMDTAADFTLHIDFTSKDIAGIVRNGTTDNYYFVKGSYADDGNSGLITGTVRYGTFNSTEINFDRFPKRFPTSASTSGGVLRGIIGQQGAVAVFISGNTLVDDDTQTATSGQFGWAGGFVVNPTAEIDLSVDYNDWASRFDVAPPATATTTPTRLNQFLNAGTDRLATASGGTPPALDFDDILDDSDSNNGVAWFSVADDPNRYHYAGIFETTDLGRPVKGQTGATAMWSGQLQASGVASALPFKLEVTFGNARTGTIAAFVESGANHYLLSGTYTANGVISGTVNFGAFMTDTRTPTDAVDTRKGVLSGLIGSNGAVGVFTSGTMISADGVIMGGTNINTGYVGGFVASPFAGAVSYRDWVSNANPPATPVIPSNSLANNLNQFVQSIGDDVNSAAHIGQSFNVNFGSLNGDPADGFNVYYITATDDYLVGISSSTSVGVPLTTAPAVLWDGSFVVYENGVATTTAFELTVNFTDSQLSATIGNYSFSAVDFEPDGFFRSSNITHTPTSNTGRLQGLIGQEGAVGVFHSNNNAAISFAGGFVAAFKPAPPPPPPASDYANFKDHYGQQVNNTQLHEDLTTGGLVAFIEGTETNLVDMSDLTFIGTGRFAPVVVRLGEASSGDHGFAIMYGDDASSPSNPRYRAGLLSETNLGAFLDSTNTAVTSWSGTIYTSFNLTSGVPASIPLTLTLDFTAGEINTTAPATHGDTNQHAITVNGRFGGVLPAGVLGGTVDYKLSGNSPINATLIGLIGADGVIGVFGSSGGLNIVGGFQARPNTQ